MFLKYSWWIVSWKCLVCLIEWKLKAGGIWLKFVLKIAVPYGVVYGCGDLIFSSHTIFTLVFVRTYQRYGTRRYCCYLTKSFFFSFFTRTFASHVCKTSRWIKHLAWLMAVIQSLLIIASRKHYTVDIVVAWSEKYEKF